MKNCLVIGANSDIYNGIKPMFVKDGWTMDDWRERIYYPELKGERWDLMLIMMGRVSPVGHWWDLNPVDFDKCIESNLTKPWYLLRDLWFYRAPNPTVIWFSGSNPQGIMDGYAPYNAAKMAVNKLIEQLDHETPDAKFVAFGPGYVRDSKIHRPTLLAGWPNPRIARGDAGNSFEQIYKALAWVIEQPKSVVGGRNVCVSDVPFDSPTESQFKLRRA